MAVPEFLHKNNGWQSHTLALAKLRAYAPRIHCLTNVVTMQDVANILLTVGGSAIMASDPLEAEEVASICHGLLLNTGTPSLEKFSACILAGKRAVTLHHPIVLDPVGAGASSFRCRQLEQLLENVHPDLIRCNLEEAITLLHLSKNIKTYKQMENISSKSIGNEEADRQAKNVICKNLESKKTYGQFENTTHGGVESGIHADINICKTIAEQLACAFHTTVLLSGITDIISNGVYSICVEGGDSRIQRVTGSGCMLSALCAAFLGAGFEGIDAAWHASGLWKYAAEYAGKYIDKNHAGMGSFHTALFDALNPVLPRITPAALRLYAVSDRSWLKKGETLSDLLPVLFENGVTCFQLREKELPDKQFLQEAFEIGEICRRFHIPFIINDNVEIARLTGADGVHVGLSDMGIERARKILGPDAIIGASAHNAAEALAAQAAGADYLGCGAVFGSATKTDAATLPFSELQAICSHVDIPVVAIGGIQSENISKLAGSGIVGAAVVSGLFAQPDITAAAKKLRNLSEQLFNNDNY